MMLYFFTNITNSVERPYLSWNFVNEFIEISSIDLERRVYSKGVEAEIVD